MLGTASSMLVSEISCSLLPTLCPSGHHDWAALILSKRRSVPCHRLTETDFLNSNWHYKDGPVNSLSLVLLLLDLKSPYPLIYSSIPFWSSGCWLKNLTSKTQSAGYKSWITSDTDKTTLLHGCPDHSVTWILNLNIIMGFNLSNFKWC